VKRRRERIEGEGKAKLTVCCQPAVTETDARLQPKHLAAW
jgi:hypothetical protein